MRIIMVLLCLGMLACQQTQEKTTRVITKKVKVEPQINHNVNIGVQEALDMINNQKDVVVLDVRTPEEIADGAYPGSIKIDFQGDNFKTEINKLDKNKSYVVYCRSGGRSGETVQFMKENGFSKAYNAKDGFEALNKAIQ